MYGTRVVDAARDEQACRSPLPSPFVTIDLDSFPGCHKPPHNFGLGEYT